jgi:hypothetical protein
VVDPRKVALFIPPGLKGFKLNLFERIGAKVGRVVRHHLRQLIDLPDEIIPIVGCTPELRPLIDGWQRRGRPWIYWDRGYARRVFATDLPVGENGGYYRWHCNAFQMQHLRSVPDDRWRALKTPLWPWARAGRHIVVAEPSRTYERFHGIEGWTRRTVAALRASTDRPIVVRDKEMQRFGRKLHEDLRDAHALVTHGSIAAVEAVIMGCPVVVDRASAAALMGLTDLAAIEQPLFPDRQPWVNALAYSQFDERELVDGTLWRLIT